MMNCFQRKFKEKFSSVFHKRLPSFIWMPPSVSCFKGIFVGLLVSSAFLSAYKLFPRPLVLRPTRLTTATAQGKLYFFVAFYSLSSWFGFHISLRISWPKSARFVFSLVLPLASTRRLVSVFGVSGVEILFELTDPSIRVARFSWPHWHSSSH